MAQPFQSSDGIQFILLFLLFPLLYFIFHHFKFHHNPPLPPGPTPWPILGNIQEMKTMTHITLANLSQTYGPLMLLRLGTQFLVVGSSPESAQEILKTNDRILSARTVPRSVPLTRSQIDRLSFWADPWSEHWKNIRTVCHTELFSTKALENQARVREGKVREMVKFLKGKEGVAVNLEDLVYATVVNIFSNAFFSRDLIGLEEELKINVLRGFMRGIIVALSAPNLADFYPVLGRFDFHGLRKKHKDLSVGMHALWESLVKERRERAKSGNSNQDLLDTLIQNGFTDEQINQLLEELFTAGIDTTTSTINRTMAELVNSPEHIKKLQLELETDPDHDPSKKPELHKLNFLQSCIKETLRLHPPAPLLLSHRAHKKCRIMNYTIPENTRVLVNVWAIGRDPSMWADPLEYRPERFFNSDVNFKGNDFQFLPFGAGRRICPGLPMATKIIPLAISALVYSFDWSYVNGDDRANHKEFRSSSRIMQPFLLIPRARREVVHNFRDFA